MRLSNMKKLLLITYLSLSANLFANQPPASDVPISPPPTVSIRNLQTAEPLRNGHYGEKSSLNTHWQLVDIHHLKIDPKKIDGTLVQFQVFGVPTKCFSQKGIANCSDLDNTVFDLIATDTGAVMLKRPAQASCLFSQNFRQIGYEHCLFSQKEKETAQPLHFLWAITPPFGAVKPL